MALLFVNEKLIGEHIYTALRDDTNPRHQVIRRDDGIERLVRLVDVWNDDEKIKGLF